MIFTRTYLLISIETLYKAYRGGFVVFCLQFLEIENKLQTKISNIIIHLKIYFGSYTI